MPITIAKQAERMIVQQQRNVGAIVRHHDTFASRCRRMLLAVGLLGLAMHPIAGLADSTDGWRDEAGGLVHFSGLRCPNRIATLARIDTNGSVERTLASCTYQAANLHAVIQIVEPNVVAGALDGLEKRFAASGFKQVSGDASAARGLTFVVGQTDQSELRETAWPIRVGANDHILWINYRIRTACRMLKRPIGPLSICCAPRNRRTNTKGDWSNCRPVAACVHRRRRATGS